MSERTDYAEALANLRVLAQRDLMRWWTLSRRHSWPERVGLLEEPFAAIIGHYGAQAALEATDYIIMSRSLDDELRMLPAPNPAPPAPQAQIDGSYRWAVTMPSGAVDTAAQAKALRRMAGVVNRLVLRPARETVWNTTVRDGTRFARVAEPGACAFCLMLASRGAVYSRSSVLRTEQMRSYHDNCRCIGIEVKNHAHLPQLNKDLAEEWEKLRARTFRGEVTLAQWRTHLSEKRRGVETG